TGYQGTPQLALALARGEADMMDTAGVGLIEPLLQRGDFAPVMQSGIVAEGKLRRRDLFAEVPLVGEMLDGKIAGAAGRAFESWLRPSRSANISRFRPARRLLMSRPTAMPSRGCRTIPISSSRRRRRSIRTMS